MTGKQSSHLFKNYICVCVCLMWCISVFVGNYKLDRNWKQQNGVL